MVFLMGNMRLVSGEAGDGNHDALQIWHSMCIYIYIAIIYIYIRVHCIAMRCMPCFNLQLILIY